MAVTVNRDKFSPNFQRNPHFQELLNEISRSPTMVEQINRFEGTFVVRESGRGTGAAKGNTPAEDRIGIDASWFTKLGDSKYRAEFVTMMGHELGHMVLPGGHQTPINASNPERASELGRSAEGVALTNAYIVAKELNSTLWGDNAKGETMSALDAIAREHGLGTPAFRQAAQEYGANLFMDAKISGQAGQRYDDDFTFHWAASRVAADNFRNIDWNHIKDSTFPDPSVDYSVGHDGHTKVDGTLPLKNSNRVLVFSGETDASGKILPSLERAIEVNYGTLSPKQRNAVYQTTRAVDQFCADQTQGNRAHNEAAAGAPLANPIGGDPLAPQTLDFLKQTRAAVNTLCDQRGYPQDQGRENMIYALAQAGLAKSMSHVDIATVNNKGMVSIAQDPQKHTLQLVTLDSKAAANIPVDESIKKMHMHETLENIKALGADHHKQQPEQQQQSNPVHQGPSLHR